MRLDKMSKELLQGPEFDTFLINKVRGLLHEEINSQQEALDALDLIKEAHYIGSDYVKSYIDSADVPEWEVKYKLIQHILSASYFTSQKEHVSDNHFRLHNLSFKYTYKNTLFTIYLPEVVDFEDGYIMKDKGKIFAEYVKDIGGTIYFKRYYNNILDAIENGITVEAGMWDHLKVVKIL
jgi:hypothetical protein